MCDFSDDSSSSRVSTGPTRGASPTSRSKTFVEKTLEIASRFVGSKTGAALGSSFGPVGTVLGGIFGGKLAKKGLESGRSTALTNTTQSSSSDEAQQLRKLKAKKPLLAAEQTTLQARQPEAPQVARPRSRTKTVLAGQKVAEETRKTLLGQ